MKWYMFMLIFFVMYSCGNDDDNRDTCNFLIDVGVNLEVNVGLPQYSQLAFAGNSVFVPSQGINGIWLYSVNSTTILAWEASDPNHTSSSCSVLTESSGGMLACGCDDGNTFPIATGQPIGGNTDVCSLKPYRVEQLNSATYLVTN